jgi:hypothetical protein
VGRHYVHAHRPNYTSGHHVKQLAQQVLPEVSLMDNILTRLGRHLEAGYQLAAT